MITLGLLIVATALLVGLTLIPLSRHEVWWVRGLDFPRMQFALFALALLIIQLLVLDGSQPITWCLWLATLGCLAYQAWWIIPYTALFPVEVAPAQEHDTDHRVRMMTANVLTPNRNAAALLDQIQEKSPDIVVTLESDTWWETQLQPLHRDYPYRVPCPLDNLYGMHLYSKLELEETSIEYLVEDNVPSIHVLVRLRNGPAVRMHFLHPAPPSPTENDASSERDAELLMVAKSVAEDDRPAIVTGDLNDVAWSATTRLFRRISGLLDPRVGRGMFNTYHADYWFIRWPLDHLFHSEHFTLRSISRLGAFGSDHFPLLTELVYEPAAKHTQQAPPAKGTDETWAEHKLDSQAADERDVPVPGGSR